MGFVAAGALVALGGLTLVLMARKGAGKPLRPPARRAVVGVIGVLFLVGVVSLILYAMQL